ncbi:hypothetical protein CANTEDRAFT_115683 [Yamadazyma tenuis ATCC 10573]|nr:uncharacterized protein CANTEDRAFT_115683 [Yamadazyma tenuis ATCC 10573]EGV62217.1 hypothetical protein CANTEDRAFT_115683 [Yamadazyma tenuis ATCC 10573]
MVMDLGEEDEINTTFKDLDLCFIRLSLTNQFKLRSAGKVPATYTRAYDVGDMVKTTGYGLFFNPKYLQPIESYGRIMVKQHLKLQDTDSHTTPVLVVTSASCWNGSSGGGLFKDEKLVGLICSNAQIKVHNPNTNDFHTEKLPKLCFILPVEVVLACFAVATQSYREFGLNLEVKNAWNLVDNHRTRFAAKL